MRFSLSPAVTFSEIDLTTIVPQVSTSVGAFVGNFVWGPCDEINLVDSQISLVNQYGRPDSNTFVDFFSAANFLDYTNNLKLVRSVGANARNATVDGSGILIKNMSIWANSYMNGQATVGEWASRYPGDLGNSLKVSICPSANAFSQNLSSAFGTGANTTNGSTQVTFSSNIIANGVVAGDLLSINGSDYVTLVNVAATGLTGNIASAATANGTLVPFTKRWQYASYVDGAPGTSSYATSVNGSRDEMHVVVVDEDGRFSLAQGSSTTATGGANTILEVFQFVSKGFDAKNVDGTTNYVRDVIANKSRYVHWMDHMSAGSNWGNTVAGTTFTDVRYNTYQSLSGGVTEGPTLANLEAGWDLYLNTETVDVSLLITGNASATLSTYVVQNIAEVRKDCVAVVSPRLTDVVDQRNNETDNITVFRNLLPSSSYMILDSGWKYQFDKYNNVYRWIPLNPDIAGLCARTDQERDPWWSPAGLNRGQIKNVVKLAWNPSKAERDDLYKMGVNSVVSFFGEGTVLFGDKTGQTKPSAFDRINVRRLFIVLEKAISTAAKYSLFEFNDQFTRAQFVSLIEPYLRDVQGRRGITAFRVICDETNNTPQVIDSNGFIGDIYIKPNRSINFIQLNFVAVGTGVEFEEVVGKF